MPGTVAPPIGKRPVSMNYNVRIINCGGFYAFWTFWFCREMLSSGNWKMKWEQFLKCTSLKTSESAWFGGRFALRVKKKKNFGNRRRPNLTMKLLCRLFEILNHPRDNTNCSKLLLEIGTGFESKRSDEQRWAQTRTFGVCPSSFGPLC